jgi:hypothetical protein
MSVSRGLVLDDEEIFWGDLDVAATLELFPECITNEDSTGHIKLREEALREVLGYVEDNTGSGEEDFSYKIKKRSFSASIPLMLVIKV